MQEVVGVPVRNEASGLEPGVLRRILAQETQRPAAERGEVRRPGVTPRAVLVFGEDDVERPVTGVLDLPLTPGKSQV